VGSRAGQRLLRIGARASGAEGVANEESDGKVLWELKRVWPDGTSHIVFEPLDFLSKLSALVFPPRMHRVRYHGAWARRSKLRDLVRPLQREEEEHACNHEASHLGEPGVSAVEGSRRRRRYDWAKLLARVWSIDVLACPRCQSRMQRVAWVMRPDSIKKILTSVGMPADSPEPAPSRWPAQGELFDAA
jgi:hypothetical protein